jgi:hypothetical protein
MSLYLYTPTLSEDAQTMTTLLGAKRLLKHDGMHFLRKGVPIDFKPGDGIICWGRHVPAVPGVPCLNSSLRYRNPVTLNTIGSTDLINAGYSMVMPIELREVDYRAYVSSVWPKSRPPCDYVPLPDLPPLGTRFGRYQTLEKILIFRGKAITEGNTDLQAHAIAFQERLGLDFVEVTFGVSNGCYYGIKLFATPKPSESLVANIQQWAVESGVQV